MTTEQAIADYENLLQNVVKEHADPISTEDVRLNPNQKQDIINKFFADYDNRSSSKWKSLISLFHTTGELAILNNRFVILTGKYNEQFKSFVMDIRGEQPIESVFL